MDRISALLIPVKMMATLKLPAKSISLVEEDLDKSSALRYLKVLLDLRGLLWTMCLCTISPNPYYEIEPRS
jgi:hypothetical protein